MYTISEKILYSLLLSFFLYLPLFILIFDSNILLFSCLIVYPVFLKTVVIYLLTAIG